MSKPKGLLQGPHRKKEHIPTGPEHLCECGCGKTFRHIGKHNRLKRFFSTECARKYRYDHPQEASEKKTEQGRKAAEASQAKRDSGIPTWRDPAFNRRKVCFQDGICAHYAVCSDQSIDGKLWKHEENGGVRCWEAGNTIMARQYGISKEAKYHQNTSARPAAI